MTEVPQEPPINEKVSAIVDKNFTYQTYSPEARAAITGATVIDTTPQYQEFTSAVRTVVIDVVFN